MGGHGHMAMAPSTLFYSREQKQTTITAAYTLSLQTHMLSVLIDIPMLKRSPKCRIHSTGIGRNESLS
jgi:hypothetical protein